VKLFYRYSDRPDDEDVQCVYLETWRLARFSASGKTVWVEPTGFPSGELKRFQPKSQRPWAHDTPEQAWAAFGRRKHWQAAILRDKLRRAMATYEFVANHPVPSFAPFLLFPVPPL